MANSDAPTGRGQPAKRQAIIDAAIPVFVRQGFTEATIDTIAAEAGVAKQTIYNHFGDKDQLFQAVMAHAQEEMGANAELTAFEQWLGRSADLPGDLTRFGDEAVRGVLREDTAALRRLLIAEWGRHPELLTEWARPRAAFQQALAGAVTQQVQRGVLQVPDPALAARQLIMVLLDEAIVRSLFGQRQLPDGEISELVRTGVEMWLRACRYRGGLDGSAVQDRPRSGGAPHVGKGLAEADGVSLYYERRGEGPPLLLITGGGGDAGYYAAMADILARDYTVLTYDRRGNSRSRLTGWPARITLAQQSEDAIAVLRANGFASAWIFGNSGGASIALDLAAYHPDAVDGVIVHEPPVPRVLPDAREYLAIYDEIERLLRTEGWLAAFTHFQVKVGSIPDREQSRILRAMLHPELVFGPGPMLEMMTRVSGNWAYLTEYEIRSFIEYEPDLDRIASNPAPVILGYGTQSRDPVAIQMSTVTAERLGAPCAEFPGAHTGPLDEPAAFAAAVQRLLDRPA